MPLRPVYTDAKDAVADIPDGSTILLGGFSAALGAPIATMVAFIESTTCKDLTFVGNGTPQVSVVRGGPMTTLDPARVRKVICSFPASNSRSRGFGSLYAEAFEKGRVELELVPQG